MHDDQVHELESSFREVMKWARAEKTWCLGVLTLAAGFSHTHMAMVDFRQGSMHTIVNAAIVDAHERNE